MRANVYFLILKLERGVYMTLPSGSLSGMNRRNALATARNLGCHIVHVNGTGDIKVSHPLMPKPVTINARRKDSGRKLTGFLKTLIRLKREQGEKDAA
jgi:hypothetical protein